MLVHLIGVEIEARQSTALRPIQFLTGHLTLDVSATANCHFRSYLRASPFMATISDLPLNRQNLFPVRIEPQPALLHIRNVPQVRSLRGSMANVNIRAGQLACAAAIEEVLHMIDRLVALRFHHEGRCVVDSVHHA